MIRVVPQPEPPTFDDLVRRPGHAAMAEGRIDPLPDYWTRCLGDLWAAYDGTCAYLAVRIPRGTGARSTDHFAPKSKYPSVAYEWSNYRLVCSLMNSRKQAFEDVLDPFEVEHGWFRLEMSSLEVLPGEGLPDEVRARVEATIHRLGLRDRECCDARAEYLEAYMRRELTLEALRRWSPFVASEVARQQITPPLTLSTLDEET